MFVHGGITLPLVATVQLKLKPFIFGTPRNCALNVSNESLKFIRSTLYHFSKKKKKQLISRVTYSGFKIHPRSCV